MIFIVPLNRLYIFFNIIFRKGFIYKHYFQGICLNTKEQKSKERFHGIYFFLWCYSPTRG